MREAPGDNPVLKVSLGTKIRASYNYQAKSSRILSGHAEYTSLPPKKMTF